VQGKKELGLATRRLEAPAGVGLQVGDSPDKLPPAEFFETEISVKTRP
jgi:hypothetical protein